MEFVGCCIQALSARYDGIFSCAGSQRIFTKNGVDVAALKRTEVFVNRIPRYLNEVTLLPIFSTAGTVHQLRLMLEFSGYNRGYCFVKYGSPEIAERAIRLLNGFRVADQSIQVHRSVDNRTLFFSNLPCSVDETTITIHIRLNFSSVVRVDVRTPQSGNRYAFVEFDTHRTAMLVKRELWPRGFDMLSSHVSVDWARPVRSTHFVLVVRNIRPGSERNDVMDFLHRYIKSPVILGVVKRRPWTYAFVEFFTLASAVWAARRLTGVKWNGRVLSISPVVQSRYFPPLAEEVEEVEKVLNPDRPFREHQFAGGTQTQDTQGGGATA